MWSKKEIRRTSAEPISRGSMQRVNIIMAAQRPVCDTNERLRKDGRGEMLVIQRDSG